MSLTLHFCYAEAYIYVILWFAGNSGEMVIYAFLLGFSSPSRKKEWYENCVKTVLASENINEGKSILGAPPKLDKKEIKNPRAKKGNTQKPKQKKQHLCHHCGATGHTRLNYYKWLATQ